jgi:hypothetical protein
MVSFKELMINRSLVALWVALGVGAGLWLLVGSVAYWVRHGWLPPDTAGWVQALGGLLAVAVAVAVPAWQKRHEIQLAAIDERKRRIDSVNAVLSLTQDLIGHHEVAIHRMRGIGRYGEALEAAQSLARVAKSYVDLELVTFGNEMVSFVLVLKSAALYAEQIAQVNHLTLARDWSAERNELGRRLKGLRTQEATLIGYFDSLERY